MDKEKITMRQAFKLLVCLSFSPAVRTVPIFEAFFAEQAGWIAPVVAFFPVFLLIVIFDKIFTVYKEESYSQIICDILGSFLGKVVLIIYIIGISILLALYIRHYAIRINISLAPNSKIHVAIISMLLLVYLALRYGLILLARMGEIILFIVVISFVVFFLLSINGIKMEHLTPISYRDIIPVGKAGYGIAGLWSYLTFLCFYSDRMTEKDEVRSVGFKYLVFFTFSTVMLGIMVIGSLGYSVVKRTSLPFFVAVKNISLFNIVERIEALAITQWMAADFILITTFFYIILKILQDMFHIEDTRYLIKMILIFFYIFTFYIASTMFELQAFSIKIGIHLTAILGLMIPATVYIVGKVRKKI